MKNNLDPGNIVQNETMSRSRNDPNTQSHRGEIDTVRELEGYRREQTKQN